MYNLRTEKITPKTTLDDHQNDLHTVLVALSFAECITAPVHHHSRCLPHVGRKPLLGEPPHRLPWLEGVVQGRGEPRAPRLFVQQHQVVDVPPLEPPATDSHRHLAALEDLQGLLRGHGPGTALVAPVAGTHVDGLAPQLADLALLLRAAHRQVGNVLQRHEDAAQAGLARLHAGTQDLKVVQVGSEATG